MLINQTIEKLKQMRLGGMAECLLNQVSHSTSNLSFEERLSLLVDYEWTHRQNRRLARLLKAATLIINACLEDIDYSYPRGLGRGLIENLSSGQWLLSHRNILISGPAGVGKTYLLCALANQACHLGLSAKYYRMSRLLADLTMARGDGSYPKFMDRLANFHLLLV